jgi:hypothetical protein
MREAEFKKSFHTLIVSTRTPPGVAPVIFVGLATRELVR